MNLYPKVQETVEKHKLLNSGDHVLVALSGGPDSVLLLHLLVKIKRKWRLSLEAVYINHQIRPRSANKEAKFCQDLCDRLKVRFHLISEDIPRLSKEVRKGLEETARDFRYEQFDKLAAKLNCNKIALGHHVDDRIETVLFRILRGTGRTGLQGIPASRGKYIRPLWEVSKDEILGYLRKNKIKFCVDQSNKEVEFTRNFIRNKLLPQIRKRINANVDQAILNLVETIKEEESYLESIVDRAFVDCVSITPAGKLVLALKHLNSYDLSIQRRLIRRCIVKTSDTQSFPDKTTIDRVLAVAREEEKAASIPGQIRCLRVNDQVLIYKRRQYNYSKSLGWDDQITIPEIGLDIETQVLAGFENEINRGRRATKVIVDFDKVTPPLLVRNIRNGDRFQPLGLKGNKKIGDYLTDRKVNVLLRDEIPVVLDAKGIIWLVGYEIDERVKMDQNTKKVLRIEYSSERQAKTTAV